MEPFKKSPQSQSKAGMDYKEIKSHSSLLSNERIAILLYMLDISSMNLNSYYVEKDLVKTKSILYQVYKNIRCILRNNSQVRSILNLDTMEPGVYTPDVAFDLVEKMLNYCMFQGYTYKRCYAIAQQLNHLEIIIRDILQFFSYFFRPDFKQKPDMMMASEKYKQMADSLTIEQLRQIVGKNNKVDFENLGNTFGTDIMLDTDDKDDEA